MSKLAWKEIDWTLVQKRLSRQQRRVFKASLEGKRSTVHALQRRIIGSLDAKLLAVQRVTTESQGRNIFSMDSLKALSNDKKIELAYKLKLDGKTKVSRRVDISKIKAKKVGIRSLDITTIEDRAKQMLVKFALEPEWEAIFEPNSYGFRPGRYYYDAVASISLSLREKPKFVLNSNVKKYFDTIDHEKLLKKIDTFEQMQNQIKSWLKNDIMIGFGNEPKKISKSLKKTSPEEIISSLLANIALHGLEDYIKDWYSNTPYLLLGYPNEISKRDRKDAIGFSRYADEFVITAPNQKDIEEIKKRVDQWLMNEVGLTFFKSKMKIVNSSDGFEFLGFQIVSIKAGNKEEYKVSIRPSRASKSEIIKRIRELIQANKSVSSYTLILLLSNQILSWANYFRYGECQKDFSKMDYIIFGQIRAWVFRRKSKGLQSRTKIKAKYFPSGNTYLFRGNQYKSNWILTGRITDKKTGEIKQNYLPKMSWVKFIKHVKIQGKASPYDGNNQYWAQRTAKYSDYSYKIKKLIQKQEGRCAICGIEFTSMDIIEADYIIPRLKGKSEKCNNFQALHKHCHIKKSWIGQSVSINEDFDVSQILPSLKDI